MHPPAKRGPKVGTKVTNKKTLDDWFHVCTLYRTGDYKHMKQAAFLKSTVSGPVFSGTRSEQMSFSTRLKLFDKGELMGGALLRQRARKYGDVEDRLMRYVELRQRRYRTDKCGINWLTLHHKAVLFAKECGYGPDFKASDGWISNSLRRHGKVGINLHGEANDMTAGDRERSSWRISV